MVRHPHVNGVELVRRVVGERLSGVRRHVFRLGEDYDDDGHGITELVTSARELAFGIGPNDTGIVIAEGRVQPNRLDPRDWIQVTDDRALRWRTFRGRRIEYVDLYGDDGDELALVFHLEGKVRFSLVLFEKTLGLGRDLEPFLRRQQALPRFVARLH